MISYFLLPSTNPFLFIFRFVLFSFSHATVVSRLSFSGGVFFFSQHRPTTTTRVSSARVYTSGDIHPPRGAKKLKGALCPAARNDTRGTVRMAFTWWTFKLARDQSSLRRTHARTCNMYVCAFRCTTIIIFSQAVAFTSLCAEESATAKSPWPTGKFQPELDTKHASSASDLSLPSCRLSNVYTRQRRSSYLYT